MKLRAMSKSGAEYILEYDGGRIFWSHRGVFYGKSWGLKNLHPDFLEGIQDEGHMWEYIREQPWAERPEVGKRLFISGSPSSGWRISTPIVSIEEVAE